MKRLAHVEHEKLDSNLYAGFKLWTEESIKDQTRANDKCRNKVDECNNYLDKYLPMFLHRQMTEMVEYVVMQDAGMAHRLHWFNEIRTPLLTTAIMCDNG